MQDLSFLFAFVRGFEPEGALQGAGGVLHPELRRLAFKLFPGRICLISDSLRCCGMPDGESFFPRRIKTQDFLNCVPITCYFPLQKI